MLKRGKVNNQTFRLLRVLFFWFCCMAVLASVGPLTKPLPHPWSLLLLLTIAAVATLGLTVVFVRWEKLQLKDVGVVPNKDSFSRVFIGFIIGLLLPCLLAALALLTGHVQFVLSQDVTIGAVLSTLLLYVIASCREELAFRAYPLRTLNYATGPWPALLIVALIFGIEHVIGGSTWLNGLIGAGVGSLLFGIAALKTKGLAFPIGIHAAWNFGQWMLGMKGDPGVWKVVIEQGYKSRVDTIGFICYLLVMGLGIAAVHFYRRRSPLEELDISSEKRDDNYALALKASKHSTQH